MTTRVRTPEDIFREERRDVYALDFSQSKVDPATSIKQMQLWFAKHMPSSTLELLAPTEQSEWMWLEGRVTSLSVNFAEGDLLKFFKKWLTPKGRSRDRRFQSVFYSYRHWWEKNRHFIPTLDKPEKAGVCIWIESPIGILSHTLMDPKQTQHPSTPKDIWANACEQWPQLRAFKLEQLRHGVVDRIATRPVRWSFIWNAPAQLWEISSNPKGWKKMLQWLCLPPDTSVDSQW